MYISCVCIQYFFGQSLKKQLCSYRLTLVLRLVVVARLVWDARLVGVAVDGELAPALARAGRGTVDDVLHGEVGGGPGAVPLHVDSVGEGAGRTHGPAGAAVCRHTDRDTGCELQSGDEGIKGRLYV